MENNRENKAKFIAQYWGQKVAVNKYTCPRSIPVCEALELKSEVWYLQLKPLSAISDEDAIKVANILESFGLYVGATEYINVGIKYIENQTDLTIIPAKITDFLRSKGYALPFMGVPVETMIEWGWVKLTEK